MLGLVDAALLGHLESPIHLASVAVGGAVLSFLYWGFSFLRLGTTGQVARANGAGNAQAAYLSVSRACMLSLAIALCLLVFREPLLAIGLTAMNADPSIASTATVYSEIRLLSAPAVLLTYCVLGWFIGHQDTRWPMVMVIITNLLNIILDALFILHFEWASEGAAIATVIAEYTGLAIGVIGLLNRYDLRLGQFLNGGLFRFNAYLSLLRSNLHLFLRTWALLFAFAFFTAAGEKLGTDVVAANAVMIQFLMFASFALDGFAYAAEGLAGEALGASDTQRFLQVAKRCALWTLLAAGLISGVILLGKPWFFPWLTGIPSVLGIMQTHGLWLVLLPLLAAPGYLLDGLFIGAGATRAMMQTMMFSAFAVYLPSWWIFSTLENHGLWLAFTLFTLSRSVTLAWYFLRFTRRGQWLEWGEDQSA